MRRRRRSGNSRLCEWRLPALSVHPGRLTAVECDGRQVFSCIVMAGSTGQPRAIDSRPVRLRMPLPGLGPGQAMA